MKTTEKYKNSISLARNTTLINEDNYKKLLENCFSILTDKEEIHPIQNLYNSKPDVTKEYYAALLAITSEFARQNTSKDDIIKYLTVDCKLPQNRVDIYVQEYFKVKKRIEISLINIGNHLPHITDVKWKVDYIVKSSEVDSSEGPLFRINLIAEHYDNEIDNKVLKNINFTCNSVEISDLIFKLKDALRHCNNLHQRVF